MFKKFRGRKKRSDEQPEQRQPEALPYRLAPDPSPQIPGLRKGSDATQVVQPSDNLQDVAGRPSQNSAIPKFDTVPPTLAPSPSIEKKKSSDRRADPQGLTVLYSPAATRTVDIIFVHGLGGSSRLSWSKNRDIDLCWPQQWLPNEFDISCSRILTFGYDAHFSSTGPSSVSNIGDFAKALLYDMKFGKDEASQDLAVGEVPIIFVVHSMGGLVFKRVGRPALAYISGQSNPEYKNVVSAVRAVLFLSTPHRGTNLAVVLNRILAASFLGHNSKPYIAELVKSSSTIEALNEDFRCIAPKLDLFCFYETLQTTVALKSMMVLEKESSILGYPGEISRPLDADHHNVCKFTNPEDPNYKSVRSALLTLVRNYSLLSRHKNRSISISNLQKIKSFLSVTEAPEDDYGDLRNRWQPGTCDMTLHTTEFTEWTQSSSSSSIFWAYARPGSGKSVLSSFLINHLKESGCICVYYLFKYLDASKRSVSSLLRSIAYQISQDIPEFKEALLTLLENGYRLQKSDARSIWQKLFVLTLFKIESARPMYWIVDALDESDSVKFVIETLSGITGSKTPIKLFVTSREIPLITKAIERISSSPVLKLCLDDNKEDIRYYTTLQIQYVYGDDQFKQDIVDQIVNLAQGNFLWVDLAIKEVMRCHNLQDTQQALREIPPGMDALYQRMEATIVQLTRPADIALSRIILTWATFSRQPLSTDDLNDILKAESLAPLNLNHTISELCGHFVVINSSGRVTLVHQTAREYLIQAQDLPFLLDPEICHEVLFLKCLLPFFDPKVRNRMRQNNLPPFYKYAATSWSYHLDASSAASNKILDNLVSFFRGTHCMNWIQMLATWGQLQALVLASRSVTMLVQKRRRLDAPSMPLLHRDSELSLLEAWAIDLLRIVGKFGTYLMQDPTGIHKYVPQLCPSNSMIHQSATTSSTQFSVVGLGATDWDDCLARLSIGSNQEAFLLVCHGRYLAVATSAKYIILWDSLTFEILRRLKHNEHIFRMCFSSGGRSIASYGFKTTRIWEVSSGREIHIINNSPDTRALALSFDKNDRTLVMASDTRKVSRVWLDHQAINWSLLDGCIMQEDTTIPDTFLNSPMAIAFSPDITELVVAYRGFPLTVWSLEDACLINRCKRRIGHHQMSTKSWTGVNRVCWHPTSGDILGIYTDGMVFKWHPVEELHQELHSLDINATPSEIVCSPDGIIFATSDVNGAVRLYNFHHFALVYQLSSEDIVTALCFAPDGKRFYDLRGSCCNVWEPNALTRLTGLDELATDSRSESESTTVSFLASEAFVDSPVIITALAASSKPGVFFTGNEEGEVRILDLTCKPQQEIGKSVTEMTVDHVECTNDGKRFAYTDLGGRLVVRAVEKLVNSTHTWGSRLIMNVKFNIDIGGVRQILLSPEGEYVLVASHYAAQLWPVERNSVPAPITPGSFDVAPKWVNHPLHAHQLLSMTTDTINTYNWNSLALDNSYQIKYPAPSGMGWPDLDRSNPSKKDMRMSKERETVTGIIVSQAHNIILLSIASPNHYQEHSTRFICFESAVLSKPSTIPIIPSIIPADLAILIAVPLAILGRDKFVFLDTSFWVCTLRLDAGQTVDKVQKHFFLPRDWLSIESLALCRVISDGTLLCPRKGEVAVVKSSLASSW
ncbi:hypothetical protein MMC18_008893 [Xylographa bjoerkii]|nr:hypothetical protein [Xylographa bjoerkii]